METKKFLVVVAHGDDEVLGCGGTISRLTQSGVEVDVCILCSPTYEARGCPIHEYAEGRAQIDKANKILGSNVIFVGGAFFLKDNQFDATPLLKITQCVEQQMAKSNPTIVLTHFKHDLNIDHRIVHQAVITACRPFASDFGRFGLSTFEVASATECNRGSRFNPNHYFHLTDRSLEKKIEAFHAYASEERDFPHPRSEEYLRALATVRGVESGWKNAEGFEYLYGVAP